MASSYSAQGASDTDKSHRAPSKIISADKVQGTEVYNKNDEKLGEIDSILIDKVSGEVAYVVMSFGGFLGVGEKFHPLPWRVLDYDINIGGYRVDLNREELSEAPAYDRDSINGYDYDTDTDGLNDYYADKFRTPVSDAMGVSDTGRDGGFSRQQTGTDSLSGGSDTGTGDRSYGSSGTNR